MGHWKKKKRNTPPGPFVQVPLELLREGGLASQVSSSAFTLLVYLLSCCDADKLANHGGTRGSRVMTFAMAMNDLGYSKNKIRRALDALIEVGAVVVDEPGGKYHGEHIPARYSIGASHPWATGMVHVHTSP